MVRLTLLVAPLLALGCAKPPLPLIEAPGARAVLMGTDASAAFAWATRLGVSGPKGAALFAVGAPWAASVLPGGDVVVVVSTNAGLAASLAGVLVLGEVRAVASDGQTTLVRADRGRVLLAPAVAPDRQTELAAILEVMATAEHPVAIEPPPAGVLRVRLADELVPLGVVDVQLLERPEGAAGGDLVLRARAPGARADIVAALLAPAPPWACALDDGALAVLAVPPMGPAALDDTFDGPMLLALYPRGDEPRAEGDPLPGAALVVAGAPGSAAVSDEILRLLPASARETRDGVRRMLEADGARGLRVVVDDGLLALGYGTAAPMSRISPHVRCPAAARPLMAGDLAALARVLPGVLPPELGLLGTAPFVARVAPDGAGLALELRAQLPPGMPF